jgi:L-arabinose isomerase
MAGLELVVIDAQTTLPEFEKELRWNDVAFRGAPGVPPC